MIGKKKCKLCATKFKKDVEFAEIRLGSGGDSSYTIECCPVCAHIIDKSADVLLSKHTDKERDDDD